MVVAVDEAATKLDLSYLLLLPAQLRTVDPCPWVRVGLAVKRVCTRPVDVQGLDASATATSSLLIEAVLHDVMVERTSPGSTTSSIVIIRGNLVTEWLLENGKYISFRRQ